MCDRTASERSCKVRNSLLSCSPFLSQHFTVAQPLVLQWGSRIQPIFLLFPPTSRTVVAMAMDSQRSSKVQMAQRPSPWCRGSKSPSTAFCCGIDRLLVDHFCAAENCKSPESVHQFLQRQSTHHPLMRKYILQTDPKFQTSINWGEKISFISYSSISKE